MIKTYVFEFTATVTKEVDIPEGLSEDSAAFESMMDTIGMEMDLSEAETEFTYYPESLLNEMDWDIEPETEPSLLS
jgi:hypothetical protein